MCHLWPSISPWNVWDLEVGIYLAFAAEVDAWRKAQKNNTPTPEG